MIFVCSERIEKREIRDADKDKHVEKERLK